jgi:hypothetical protein
MYSEANNNHTVENNQNDSEPDDVDQNHTTPKKNNGTFIH